MTKASTYTLLLFALLILCSFGSVCAQFDYKRASLTVLVINNPTEPGNDLIVSNAIREIEDKYNNHNIDVAVLNLPEGTTFDEESRLAGIEKALKDQHIGARMLSNWFEDSLGNFSWKKVQKRGLYSARLFDFKNADRTTMGSALLENIGRELIKKTYLLVLDFRNISSTEGTGDAVSQGLSLFDRRFSGIRRNVEIYGYTAQCFTYLYKLKYEKDQYIQMNKVWNNKQERWAVDVPLKLEDHESFTGLGVETGVGQTTRKADTFYIKLLEKYCLERAVYRYSRKFDAFTTKAVVMPTPDPKKASRMRPGALVGRKEGLKIDQRYIAYYRVERKDGTSFYRRMATLRADRVVDNRMIVNDNTRPSRFYYDSGFNIKNGALIKEARDLGMGISAYVASTDLRHIGVRYDYNLSQLSTRMKPQLRLNVEYSQSTVVDPNATFDRITVHWYGLGISRQFNTSKNLKTEIHAGYLWTKASVNWSEKAERYQLGDTSGESLQLGLRFLINVAPSSRLFVDIVGKDTDISLASQLGVPSSYIGVGFRFAL